MHLSPKVCLHLFLFNHYTYACINAQAHIYSRAHIESIPHFNSLIREFFYLLLIEVLCLYDNNLNEKVVSNAFDYIDFPVSFPEYDSDFRKFACMFSPFLLQFFFIAILSHVCFSAFSFLSLSHYPSILQNY